MSDTHDHEHAQWLEQLLAGEVAPDTPEARERLRACARCREELGGLLALGARLDAAGADMRADLEAADHVQDPGEERIRARVSTLAAGPRRRRVLAWLVAAAAVVATILAWRLATAPSPEPPLVLGDEDADWELSVEPGPDGYARFSWRYRGEPSGYVLRISDALAPPGATPEEIRCSVPEWIPTEEEERRLAERIRWQVLALGPSGERDDVLSRSPWVSASR